MNNQVISNGHANNEPLSICVSAPGKVILHGEHSVVYGKLAIAGSLGLRTKIKLIEIEQRRIGIEMKALNLSKHYNLDELMADLSKRPPPLLQSISHFNIEQPELINHEILLKQIEEIFKCDTGLDYFQKLSLTSLFYLFHSLIASVDVTITPFDLIIDTDLTVSAGTGSSASYLVCVAAIFYQYIRMKTKHPENISKPLYKPCKLHHTNINKFDTHELALISKWAYCAERIIHGAPSGVDNTICTYGALVEFRKASGAKQLDIPLKFKVLLVNTKVPRNTVAMVRRVVTVREKYGGVIDAVLEALDAVALEALDCFKNFNRDYLKIVELYEKLGELTDMNQNLLSVLNVSHPKLDKICSIIRQYGLHGKLTGAGGGGYAIALVPPYFEESTLCSLINALIGEGFDALVTDLGGPGVAIDS